MFPLVVCFSNCLNPYIEGPLSKSIFSVRTVFEHLMELKGIVLAYCTGMHLTQVLLDHFC